MADYIYIVDLMVQGF